MPPTRGKHWQLEAACRGLPLALFFADRYDHATVAHARSVCARCPVRAECRDYALADADLEGLWGGTTTNERLMLRRGAASGLSPR